MSHVCVLRMVCERLVGHETIPWHSGFLVADRGAFQDAELKSGNGGRSEDSAASCWRCG